MIELTWSDFEQGVDALVEKLEPHVASFRGVCGVPRGGLPLAVALSHRMGLPLLERPRVGCLIVDDIFETGKTLSAMTTANAAFAVWITKRPVGWVTAARQIESEEWVLFPWEDKAGALIDEAKYRASR